MRTAASAPPARRAPPERSFGGSDCARIWCSNRSSDETAADDGLVRAYIQVPEIIHYQPM
jgi:hypothetical protein